jgi:hypothetical protein
MTLNRFPQGQMTKQDCLENVRTLVLKRTANKYAHCNFAGEGNISTMNPRKIIQAIYLSKSITNVR